MPRASHSDLEVYYADVGSVPFATQEEKIALQRNTILHPIHLKGHDEKQQPTKPTRRRVCGIVLTPVTICLFITSLILLIGGIAGGIAGGILGTKHTSSTPLPSRESTTSTTGGSSQSTSTSAPTTTKPSALTTTTQVLSPTQTLYRDCPSSNNTIYNALGSSAYQFRKICNRSYKQPPANVVNAPAASLDDCIDLCVAYNVNNKSAIASGTSPLCNSVCWRNNSGGGDPNWPGQCFGSTTLNATSSGGFQYNNESVCDAGAWINQDFSF